MISVPELLRWFTSLSIAPASYIFRCSGDSITAAGLLHSEIRGSKDMCSFPRLIAAYHVLLRLAAPRHPPWTCIRLTISFFPPRASFAPRGLFIQASPFRHSLRGLSFFTVTLVTVRSFLCDFKQLRPFPPHPCGTSPRPRQDGERNNRRFCVYTYTHYSFS